MQNWTKSENRLNFRKNSTYLKALTYELFFVQTNFIHSFIH